MMKVFTKMGIGLGVTALTAFLVFQNLLSGGFMLTLMSNTAFVWILFLAEIGIAVSLSAGLTRFSAGTCSILFYVYAVMTGITFSVLPAAYGISTIFTAFLFAAVLYVCCAILGHTTNVDLTKFSGLLVGGLITLLIVSLLSFFIPALRNSLFISYLGVIIFLFYTAWDVQKLKALYYQTQGTAIAENVSVYGAFELYLDFVNLFLYILRILGGSSRRD